MKNIVHTNSFVTHDVAYEAIKSHANSTEENCSWFGMYVDMIGPLPILFHTRKMLSLRLFGFEKIKVINKGNRSCTLFTDTGIGNLWLNKICVPVEIVVQFAEFCGIPAIGARDNWRVHVSGNPKHWDKEATLKFLEMNPWSNPQKIVLPYLSTVSTFTIRRGRTMCYGSRSARYGSRSTRNDHGPFKVSWNFTTKNIDKYALQFLFRDFLYAYQLHKKFICVGSLVLPVNIKPWPNYTFPV